MDQNNLVVSELKFTLSVNEKNDRLLGTYGVMKEKS